MVSTFFAKYKRGQINESAYVHEGCGLPTLNNHR
jgi:hypothetical protein